MKAVAYLKIKAKRKGRSWGPWECGEISVRRQKPDTEANEVAVRIDIDIPDAYFEVPELVAKIAMPEVDSRTVINTEVQEGISEAISSQLGMKCHVQPYEVE